MEIAIRTDASHAIGSGHLIRCMALANEMRNLGWNVVFVSSRRENKWIDLIKENRFECEVIETPVDLGLIETSNQYDSFSFKSKEHSENYWQQDAVETKQALEGRLIEWLIVDHYGLDSRWESALRACTNNIMVIDDLADRKHDCDILVDCVYGRTYDDYFGLVPSKCRMLLGTMYALIRPEFCEWRGRALERRSYHNSIEKVLVSLGGVDKGNLTGRVLERLQNTEFCSRLRIEVVVGHGFENVKVVKDLISSAPFEVTFDVGINDMARRIAEADLGIGAFGVSTWERFCLGLPSVNFITEANQIDVIEKVAQNPLFGVIHSWSLDKELHSFLENILNDDGFYHQIVNACSLLVDGKGLPRVISEIQRA